MRLLVDFCGRRGGSRLLVDTLVAGGLAKCAVQQRRFDSGLMGFGLASAAATLRPGGWPLDPALESLSWTVILQGALVLGIWSTNRGAAGQRANRTAQARGKAQAMLAAFFFGCIGSLAGSFLGVQVAGCFAQTAADRQVWPIAASCLAASYIGGTANFFETAAALGAKSSPSTLKALNLIAGIDILVMVAYFGVLLWLRSEVMQGRGLRTHDFFCRLLLLSSAADIIPCVFLQH